MARVEYNDNILKKLSKKQLKKIYSSKTSPTLEMVHKRLGIKEEKKSEKKD